MKVNKPLIGSVSLKNHPEWKTKKKIRKWLKGLRGEWEKRLARLSNRRHL